MKGVVFQLCGIFHVLHLKCHTLLETKRFLDLIWRRGSLSFYRVNYGLQRSFWENPWTFSIWSSKMAAILPYYVHHSSKIRGLDSKKCSSEMCFLFKFISCNFVQIYILWKLWSMSSVDHRYISFMKWKTKISARLFVHAI